LWRAAERRGVPLTLLLVIIGLVVFVFLTGLFVYELRAVLLVIFLAALVAILLNPFVVTLQRWRFYRRGLAVTVVAALAVLAAAGLAVALAHPFVSAVNDLAAQLPTTARQAEHGKGWLGQLATRYHLQAWVRVNAPKLAAYGKALTRPILNLGHGTISFVLSVSSFCALVLLFLLDGPRLRAFVLGNMSPARAAFFGRGAAELNRCGRQPHRWPLRRVRRRTACRADRWGAPDSGDPDLGIYFRGAGGIRSARERALAEGRNGRAAPAPARARKDADRAVSQC
jgi:predicted PurR-regulated permease PerM